jgi:hypothetical protein
MQRRTVKLAIITLTAVILGYQPTFATNAPPDLAHPSPLYQAPVHPNSTPRPTQQMACNGMWVACNN